jgi:hypothetical protein
VYGHARTLSKVAASPLDEGRDLVARVAALDTAEERALGSNALILGFQSVVEDLAVIRRDALDELLKAGRTRTQLAALLNVSRARISQILTSAKKPERAFLGTSPILVAIGAHRSAGRRDPLQTISPESHAAFEMLAEFSQTLGLEMWYDIVAPPGHVDLNRPNLIVLNNPGVLPFLGQVMGADPRLRFRAEKGRWLLENIESGTEYRSLQERGMPADYGYLGRLPRPDGKGTFLYIAGTREQGTLGATRYLIDNLARLYREVKTERFSMIINCAFDPDNTRSVTSTKAVTPPYPHEA